MNQDDILALRVVGVTVAGIFVGIAAGNLLGVIVAVNVINVAVAVAVKTSLQLAVTVNILPYDGYCNPCVGYVVTIGILKYVNLVGLVGIVLNNAGIGGIIGLGDGVACGGINLYACVAVSIPDAGCLLRVEGKGVVVTVIGLPGRYGLGYGVVCAGYTSQTDAVLGEC